MRWILVLILCGTAWGQVPVRSCNTSGVSGTLTCSITVVAHHLVTAQVWTAPTQVVTYSDTQGNSFSQSTSSTCNAVAATCNPGVAFAGVSSPGFASLGSVQFYFSTGSFSGADTFTVGVGTNGSNLYVAEYGEDLVGVDAFTPNVAPSAITTSGTNDLIISVTADGGAATCSAIAPNTGFTLEYSQNAGCKSFADQIDLPPGTYNAGTALTGANAAVDFFTIAFGVAPFISSVRHRSQIY